MPGITYNVGELESLSERIGFWSKQNFGRQLPQENNKIWSMLRCVTGMTEEIGELLEQTEIVTAHPKMDVSEALDAIADICVFALDFMFKSDLSVRQVLLFDKEPSRWEREFWMEKVNVGDCALDIATTGLSICNAKLSHHVLKLSQEIRMTEGHWDGIRLQMCHVWRLCYTIVRHLNQDLNDVVKSTAEKVLRRDWRKNPDTAHEDEG